MLIDPIRRPGRRDGVIGICLDCGKSFTPFRRILMRCDDCRIATCAGCGTLFRKDRPTERYCTNECRKAGKPKITCAHCGKVVTVYRYRADTAQYCSVSCGRMVVSRAMWAVATPARRKQAADHIAAVGRARGKPRPCCLDCGVQLKTLGSKRCHSCVNLASPRGVTLRPPDSLVDSWYAQKCAAGYRTDIEGIVEQRLIALRLAYQFEAPVHGFVVDFLIPTLRLAIECDGAYWHSLPGMAKRDQRKNGALSEAGYHVLRLAESAIKSAAFIDLLDHTLTRLSEASIPSRD